VNFRVVVLPGDGIGPEVTAQAVRVLTEVVQRAGHELQISEALIGGAAIDATGTALPESTVSACTAADAIFLGAVGGPRWDDPGARVRPEQGLLGIRKALGLFANLRPVAAIPALYAASPLKAEVLHGVDLIVVRELTGGIYFGEQRRGTHASGEFATDTCTYTTAEIERVVRMAAHLARGRRRKITSVDKANVMETSRLWRQVTTRVMAQEFPDLQLEHLLVDACAMHLVRRPADFDVIVTENLFGDVLTDEAAVLAGSIGVLPSASLGERRNRAQLPVGLYEPIHGSAPAIAGQGIANPIGAILSAAMLLRHSFGLEQEARAIESAVTATLDQGIRTPDMTGEAGSTWSTGDVGSHVLQQLEAQSAHV
jgi:3-isopropylmalate dehydrogenase